MDTGVAVVLVGVSVGFRHEATGLVVVERRMVPKGKAYAWIQKTWRGVKKPPDTDIETRQDLEPRYEVSHIERLGPPTTLPAVAERLDRVLGQVIRTTSKDIVLIGEVFSCGLTGWTSVLEKVQEHFTYEAGTTLQQNALKVTNGGIGQAATLPWPVGRSELLAASQFVFDERQLKIQKDMHGGKELLNSLQSLDPSRHRPSVPDPQGGREVEGDDLAYALGCACFAAVKLGKERFVRVEFPPPLEDAS
jgi:hypothetical protein